jgi:DNA-binding transcriptional MerR regulator
MYKGFSRQEVSILTGLSLNQLDYLSRQEIVKPEKFGNSRNASVLYTWNQVIDLKIINELKKRKVALKHIYSIVRGARKVELDWLLFENTMAIVENSDKKLFTPGIWTNPTLEWLKQSGENYLILFDAQDIQHWLEEMRNINLSTNVCYIPPIGNIINQVKETGKNKIVDFEKRLHAVA